MDNPPASKGWIKEQKEGGVLGVATSIIIVVVYEVYKTKQSTSKSKTKSKKRSKK